MDEEITISIGLLLALFPIAIALGGFLAATFYRMNPMQRRHDEMLIETLDAAEKRVKQLQTDVNGLEVQVKRLREDLSWERERNRELRKEVTILRPLAVAGGHSKQ